MNIDINTESARATNNQLSAIINHVIDIKHAVSRLRLSIDPEVLSHRNLRERFAATQRNIESIESALSLLQRTTMQNISSYEVAEMRANAIIQRVPTKPGG